MDLETYFLEKMVSKDKFRRKLGFAKASFFKMLNDGNMRFDWVEKIISETDGRVKLTDLYKTYLQKSHKAKKGANKTKRKQAEDVE